MRGSVVKIIVAVVLVTGVAGGLQAAGHLQAAAPKPPIKLGAIFALSGPDAPIGIPGKLAAQMAVDQINHEGGIKGRPLILLIGDNGSDPAMAATLAQKFIYADKVAALVGPTTAVSGMQVRRIVDKAGVPAVMCAFGDQVIAGCKLGTLTSVFNAPPHSSVVVKRLFSYLKKKKIIRLGLLCASDRFGQDGAYWLKKLAPDYGLTIVAQESFDPHDPNLVAQLIVIKNAKPQGIICWTLGPAGAIVAKNRAQLGLKLPLFQSQGQADPQYLKLAGPAAEGSCMPSTKLMVADQLPDKDPQKKVIQNFIHLYRDVYHYNQQYPLTNQSGYAWDAVTIVADGIWKAGPTPKALCQATANTRGYVGVSGIYNLGPMDYNGLAPDSLVVIQVREGRFVLAQ
jgi:branched-chain amino acid transport system substrate-binding protein